MEKEIERDEERKNQADPKCQTEIQQRENEGEAP